MHTPPSPTSHQADNRYLASDYTRLTKRATRRFTTPASTPDLARAHAQEPPPAQPKSAAAPTSGQASSDKRASASNYQSVRLHLQASQSSSRITQSTGPGTGKVSPPYGGVSRTGSFGGPAVGQLDACVKEDNTGMHSA